MTVEAGAIVNRQHTGDRGDDGAGLGFAPIQQLRAHEYVAEQVRRHVALRLIAPGEALPPERELAATFGVGRPTIQHALRLLEADRLVEARRGRHGGTFVSQPAENARAMDELLTRLLHERSELEDALAYRRLIEPRVAREAARTRTRDDLAAISGAIAAMASATSEPDYMRHDTEFHLGVARATHNRFLLSAIEDVRLCLNDAMSLLPESDTWHRRLSGEHEAILAAIKARDGDAAEHAMDLHVAASELSLRALMTAIKRRLGS
ncbi:MAG TPA: FadR/GntR family transcriptional regulator [Solirubrobacteraceae bacterium]|nr:FadR/GntR family transcriptional regulator [Solirubrobacteraceae bacterium]